MYSVGLSAQSEVKFQCMICLEQLGKVVPASSLFPGILDFTSTSRRLV